MSWYKIGEFKTALRKHVLRADLRVYIGDPSNYVAPNELTSLIKSICGSAIIKGLDVLGIVSPHGPENGWMARQQVAQSGIDLWVVPGQEYRTNDKVTLFVYNLKTALQPNMSMAQACQFAHSNGGFVMASGLNKRVAQAISSMKGQPTAPDAVEIYNAATGGYQDVESDLPKFISSCAKSATELEEVNVYTLINRKQLEEMGLLPPEQGKDYVPGYLQRADEAELNQMNPQGI